MKIYDFDLARKWGESEVKTMTFGTRRYMAPKMFRNNQGSFRVSLMLKYYDDFYSFTPLKWKLF